jgi:hypothetical protein
VKIGPTVARNQYWLAKAYVSQGKHSEAVAAFKAAKTGEGTADLKDLDELLKQSQDQVASADSKS